MGGRIISHLYVFIDESGDPGDSTASTGASSPHYAELAIQLDDQGLIELQSHMTSWKYCSGRFREDKNLPKDNALTRYINPFKELCQAGYLCCSCVYLIKSKYTGPHFGNHPTHKQNPILFRNFIHRRLLEFHFTKYKPTKEDRIQLIFDKYDMSHKVTRNLEDYLRANYFLPQFDHICHVDSIYTLPIQATSQMLVGIKDIILGKADDLLKTSLDFISLKEITQ